MFFHYGVDGITGFTLKLSDTVSQEYIYKKNIQGDIIGIYDSNDNLICKYIYDAWGNHNTCILYQNANNIEKYVDLNDEEEYNILSEDEKTIVDIRIFIATLNPFRYRGYYYDTETGLYYLNSRYYDPETGRFINADDISNIDKENLNGFNLYTYCANNPVMHTDENGDAWWNPFSWSKETWMKIGSGFLIVAGAVLTVVTGPVGAFVGGVMLSAGTNSLINGYINDLSGGSFAAGWTGGLVTGTINGIFAGIAGNILSPLFSTTMSLGKTILSTTSGMLISFMGGGVGSFAGSYVTSKIDNKPFNIHDALANSIISGFLNIFAGFSSGLSNSLTAVTEKLLSQILGRIVPFVAEGILDWFSIYISKHGHDFVLY